MEELVRKHYDLYNAHKVQVAYDSGCLQHEVINDLKCDVLRIPRGTRISLNRNWEFCDECHAHVPTLGKNCDKCIDAIPVRQEMNDFVNESDVDFLAVWEFERAELYCAKMREVSMHEEAVSKLKKQFFRDPNYLNNRFTSGFCDTCYSFVPYLGCKCPDCYRKIWNRKCDPESFRLLFSTYEKTLNCFDTNENSYWIRYISDGSSPSQCYYFIWHLDIEFYDWFKRFRERKLTIAREYFSTKNDSDREQQLKSFYACDRISKQLKKIALLDFCRKCSTYVPWTYGVDCCCLLEKIRYFDENCKVCRNKLETCHPKCWIYLSTYERRATIVERQKALTRRRWRKIKV